MSVAPSIVCLLVLAASQHAMAKNYYVQATTRVNWYIASETCAAQGRQLATITSQSDENDIERAITAAGIQTEFIWISATDQAVDGKFVWFPTGQAVTYTKWNTGQPDNFQGNEDCVHLANLPPGTITWNDYVCTTPMYFVCEDKICKNDNVNKCNKGLVTLHVDAIL